LEVVDAISGKRVAEVRGQASREGTARLEVPALPAGAYRAVASVTHGESDLGSAEQALAVRESGPELEDPLPRPELLAQIAAATGGAHAELGEGFPRLKTVHESQEVEIGGRTEEPLWDNLAPMGLLAVLLAAEWVLRRRWGLP
jgi:hypothetical protein